jgi:hypothetical protein
MSEPVSITEELRARIEELTRECDDRRRRCAMLARAHGALADAGCIVPTEMDETIEHAIKALAKERDEARAELAKESECADAAIEWQRGCYEARTEVERLSESARAAWEAECIMRGQRDEARAEADLLRGCNREHMWTWKTDGLTACAMCGVVQREDHANKPCGGVVRVGVRIEDERASAFRRGAEAMRLACIEEVRFLQRPPTLETIKSLRALPIPEDKP